MTHEQRFQRAIKWAFVMNWGQQGLLVAVTFILASILGPSTWGTLAMAAVYVHFINMFHEASTAPLIQRETLRQEQLDSAFWVVLASSLILIVISISLADWWAGVNHVPELALVVTVLSTTLVVRGLSLVQEAVLKRELNFKALAIRRIVAALLAGGVAITLALSGFGIWALVAQHLCSAVIGLLLLWRLSDWRPGFRFSSDGLAELFRFWGGSLLTKLGYFVTTRSHIVLMGIFFGPVPVGLFRFARSMVNRVLQMTLRPFQMVAFPEMSRAQSDQQELGASVLRSIKGSCLFTIPVLAGIAATSDFLVGAVGVKWQDAADVVKLLCVAGIAEAFSMFTGPLLLATGRPYSNAALIWTRGLLSTGSVCIMVVLLQDATIWAQIMGVAAAKVALGLVLWVPVNTVILLRLSGVRLVELIAALRSGLFAGFAALWAVNGFTYVFSVESPLLMAILGLLVAGAAAAATLLLCEPEIRNFVTAAWVRLTGANGHARPLDDSSTEESAQIL